MKQFGYCCVGVSEGLQNAGRQVPRRSRARSDAFGHAQLGGVGAGGRAAWSRTSSATSIHWAVADYLQRAARHIASKTDVEQAYAVGKAAVELALEGHNAVMPTIVRVSDRPYRWKIGVAPLERRRQRRKDAAARLHHAATASASPTRRATYLAPLISGEAPPPYQAMGCRNTCG